MLRLGPSIFLLFVTWCAFTHLAWRSIAYNSSPLRSRPAPMASSISGLIIAGAIALVLFGALVVRANTLVVMANPLTPLASNNSGVPPPATTSGAAVKDPARLEQTASDRTDLTVQAGDPARASLSRPGAKEPSSSAGTT